MPKPQPDPTSDRLLHNLLGFIRALRRSGLPVGTSQVLDFIRALRWVDLSQKKAVYHAGRALLVNRAEHIEVFREVFAAYWGDWERRSSVYDMARRSQDERPLPGGQSDLDRSGAAVIQRPAGGPDSGGELWRAYSAVEALRDKDFSQLDEEEKRAVRWMIAELNLELGERRSRRWRLGNGRRVDLRRSVQANLRHGGEWMTWIRRGPRSQARPMVVLADISGSMEVYTRVLLQFVYGLVRGSEARVEAFVFGTRLTRITRHLQQADPRRALARVTKEVPDWSGGTRIGRALRTFNKRWARRALGRGAVVLLVSDGWDRGDPELLRQEMARLQRSSHRLIWLNPLLGSDEYEPLTRGMQAALPHVDDFLPVHNFASLEHLAGHLQALDERAGSGSGPARRRLEPAGGRR